MRNCLNAGGSGACILNVLCVNGETYIAKLLFAEKRYDVSGELYNMFRLYLYVCVYACCIGNGESAYIAHINKRDRDLQMGRFIPTHMPIE